MNDPIILFVDFRNWSYWAIMFVNVRFMTKQIGNTVVKAYNEILPKMHIVSSGHEPSIYCRECFISPMAQPPQTPTEGIIELSILATQIKPRERYRLGKQGTQQVVAQSLLSGAFQGSRQCNSTPHLPPVLRLIPKDFRWYTGRGQTPYEVCSSPGHCVAMEWVGRR